MSQLQHALDKAVIGLFRAKNSTFLATLYCGLKFSWSTELPTAGVGGKRLLINPDWFLTLTERSRVSLLAHELWHVALMHAERRGTRDQRIFNMAADHAINLMLIAEGYHFDMPYLGDPIYQGMSTEEIYDDLMSNSKTIELPFGDELLPPDPEAPDPLLVEAEVQALVVRAAVAQQMADKGQGNLPGELTEILDKLLKPEVPWERLLERWLTERSEQASTYRRPNRRYQDEYLPSRGGESGLAHLLYGLDSSGSMSLDQLRRSNSEMAGAYERLMPEKMTVVTFDTCIRDVWEFGQDRALEALRITGRGGTDMDELFTLAARMRPDAMVVFSDMECDIPEQIRGVDVLWVCVDNPDWEPPYGSVIHVRSNP